jgi:hypothetical protein
MDFLTFTQSSFPISLSLSLSQPQLTSLLKSLANLKWGQLLRAVEMCISWRNSAATNGRGEGYKYPSPKKLAVGY